MNKKIGIFVPARLGSHRLPNKQILPIGDTFMFKICCKKLSYIKKVYNIPTYVLICDKELIEIAKIVAKIGGGDTLFCLRRRSGWTPFVAPLATPLLSPPFVAPLLRLLLSPLSRSLRCISLRLSVK